MHLARPLRHLTLATALLTSAGSTLSPLPLDAQGSGEGRLPRRYVFGAFGALVAGVVSAKFFAPGSAPGKRSCSACVISLAAIGGGLGGYAFGRQLDQLYALRYRHGAPLTPRTLSVQLDGEPSLLAAADSVVAVAGVGGVQLFASAVGLEPLSTRATAVRGATSLAVTPRSPVVALGTGSGLYAYPLSSRIGLTLREGAVSALAASRDRLFAAVGGRIETIPASSDSASSWPGLDVGRAVEALEWDERRSLLWAVADSVLLVFRAGGDSLVQTGAMPLGASGRRVSVAGDRGAVALGEAGVIVLDTSNPAAPQARYRWSGARFAYDVSMVGNRLYIAAGAEGVYVLELRADRLVTVGLARGLGFATSLASREGFTYILDRSTFSLRRISSDF